MAFRIGLTGLQAASADLQVTANNIANSNTTGFKSSRAQFADVFSVSGHAVSQTAIGNGVQLAAVAQQFNQGNLNYTSNNLDLALSGNGFFTVRDSKGLAYTRAGAFHPDRQGYVVNSRGQHLQVYPPLGNGTFNTSTMTDLQMDTSLNSPAATTKGTIGVNLSSTAQPPVTGVFDPNDPTSYNNSTSLTLYDSLGSTHTATFYFVKQAAANTWETHLYIDGAADGGAQNLQFTNAGALQTPVNGKLTFPAFNPGNGSNPLNLTFNFGGSTQYGDKFTSTKLTQNGYATGLLSGIDVAANGIVSARYSNGQARSLGQVAVTTFANPNGLQQLGNTSWGETYTSGQALHGIAGRSNFGLIQAGALESSNVDLTAQLVNMIKAQRNFQANAKTISTASTITNAIMQIRT